MFTLEELLGTFILGILCGFGFVVIWDAIQIRKEYK